MCSTPDGGWLKLDPHIPISAGSTAFHLNLEGVFGSCKILQATRDQHRRCSSCVVVRIDQSAIELGTRTEGLFLLGTSHEMHSVDTSVPPRICMRHGMLLRRYTVFHHGSDPATRGDDHFRGRERRHLMS